MENEKMTENETKNEGSTLTSSNEVGEPASAAAANSFVPVSEIRITQPGFYVEKGKGYKLQAEVLPENATNKTLKWSSSNQMEIWVDGDDLAALNGSATITAKATDGSGVKATRAVRTVTSVLPKSIKVTPEEHYLVQVEEYLLRAKVLPKNATCSGVTWYSDDTNIASVNPSSGLVIGLHPGTTKIYAKAIDGSEIVGSCTVHIMTRQRICLPVDRCYNWYQYYSGIASEKRNVACAWTCGLDVANIYGPGKFVPSDMDLSSTAFWNNGYTWRLPEKCRVAFENKYTVFKDSASYYSQIRSEIHQNKPVVIRLQSEDHTHFVVAYGYYGTGTSPSEIRVFDPAKKDKNDERMGWETTLDESMNLAKTVWEKKAGKTLAYPSISALRKVSIK